MYDGTIIVLYAAPAMYCSSYYTQRGTYGLNCQMSNISSSFVLPSEKLFRAGWVQSLFSRKKDRCQCKAMSETIADFILTQLCILRYCKMQAEDLLLDKLHLYLALLATLDYVQKIILIVIIDTTLKTPATHLLAPPKIPPTIWHQMTFMRLTRLVHVGM